MSENRLLILLNPGKQSRHYMLGLARAADAIGVSHVCVEMAPLWARCAGAGPSGWAERARVQVELARLVRRERLTHVLGYAWNGVFDFGLLSAEPDDAGEPLFAALGLKHIQLWTDHPNWFHGGEALQPELARLLDHPNHIHILKSESAAAEAGAVLGWRNTLAMPMAEDYENLRVRGGERPVHDVVAIIGGGGPLVDEAAAWVGHDAPDVGAICAAVAERVLERWARWARKQDGRDVSGEALVALGEALVAERISKREDAMWRLAAGLDEAHARALGWLRADATRWYSAMERLRQVTDWRRGFMLAWLAQRVDVGLYGASAAAMGISQPAGAEEWVEYESQASVYARGRVAININAGHDEEGCTHKPFQVAASGVACVHHATRGIEDVFEPGREIELFDSPAGVLETVRRLAGDERMRRDLGAAMHERAKGEHTWEARLGTMLEAADGVGAGRERGEAAVAA